MYPPEITEPCRHELTDAGFEELRTPEAVDAILKDKKGTALVVVNSVCGCAAGGARPGVLKALQQAKVRPDKITTVFAGVDAEATDKARSYMTGYNPSSPAIALFKDGEVVFMVERYMIEGTYPQHLADALSEAFETHCTDQ